MENFAKKTFTTSRSLTYTYYDSARPTDDASKPTFFLLHGFPDSAHLWAKVIPHLLPLTNRIIIPDQLGYGGTSKPTDPAIFNSKDSVADYVELLRSEHVTRIVAVGHDWGSFSAQRMWLWAPELVVGVALLNVAYIPPSPAPFDLAATNDFFEHATGFPRYAYWELFTAADGAAVCDAHLESLWRVAHGNRQNWMRDMFCVRGAMRDFLLADRADVELHEYAQPGNGWREEWLRSVREGGGLASALCWYKALASNHHYEVEKELPQERIPIAVPTFFLACERDDVCLPALIEKNRADGHVGPDLSIKSIDSAHWCTMEKPDEVGKALYEWLSSKF